MTAFTDLAPQGSCRGVTNETIAGTPAYAERIVDGWYKLPGTTDYYGDDRYGSGLVGAQLGVGPIFTIDDACGPTGKAVYDAALIADPEIDYSNYDTDKDGVVDFFMMVYVGLGGHGASQVDGQPPYDNIWPHSSSLEFNYVDEETGLSGYISDDQLKDYRGRKLYYKNEQRLVMMTKKTRFPVYVRVGPYNVNPESAVDKASVISHEYGHSLGLPDFYSLGDRGTYGDWNLMATDKSQHMDVFGKQELGWLVPRVIDRNTNMRIKGWRDSKRNTHKIAWKTPTGRKYVLKGRRVNNGQAYAVKLPPRQVIDPAIVEAGATPHHVWWSKSGNDFGCPPVKGHNLDIFLPELERVEEGTTITVTFKSHWDIEWDYDYGFVMYSTDAGQTYTSMPSANGYTTPAAINPNQSPCQQRYGNGITGSTGSYEAGTDAADRGLGEYPEGGFVEDSYDLSAAAGNQTVLRFSYATDPGLARPGWFIDDLVVRAGEKVIYRSNFEKGQNEIRVFSGGCKDELRVAAACTQGWSYLSSKKGALADHAYYMEMRDRSGFDFEGHGQNDREAIAFAPGLLLVYTDEVHGYGNVGTDDPPAQTPLDSQPQATNIAPDLNDAAFTAVANDNIYSDFGEGWTDNYTDGTATDAPWILKFNCLSFKVLSMTGQTNGPERSPGDLRGTVSVRTGKGCGKFNYGVKIKRRARSNSGAAARYVLENL